MWAFPMLSNRGSIVQLVFPLVWQIHTRCSMRAPLGVPALIMSLVVPIFWVICAVLDRKSTRLNSSHVAISYAVFCLKKKILQEHHTRFPERFKDNVLTQLIAPYRV